jgi:diguanylate cyclase (GGDEF)-like protein
VLRAEEVAAAEVVAEVVADWRMADPGRNAELRVPEEPRPIRGDAEALRMVVSNLVDNAGKHAPPGTPIGVAVQQAPGRTRIEVTDRGPGVVHLSGGTIEMHFHFFVVVGLITLYQDWVPFGLALLHVVVHHGVLGSLAPTTVFSHPAAQAAPRRWALVHGAFVLAACAANLVTWRLSEVQAAEISRLVSRLEGLARTDPLTGIPNRRVWDEEVPTELERARRTGASLCLAMLDLDRFKDFNDQNGHQEGDRLLKEVAAAWRLAVRTTDLLARYGGEEFGLLLPACSMHDAIEVVQRVQAATPAAVTCSIGVASWDFHEGADELVRRADEALYAAKAGGRDRYVTASA